MLQFVHINAAIIDRQRRFDFHLPVCQIFPGDESALFTAPPHEFFRNIAPIKTVVGSINGIFSGFTRFQGVLFGLHQLLQGKEQIALGKNFSGIRCLPLFTRVRQEYFGRIRPLFDQILLPLDGICRLGLYRIALRHLHGRGKHLFQTHGAVLGQHDEQTTRCSGGHSGQCAVLGRVFHPLFPEKFRRCTRRGHSKCVYTNNLSGFRIINQCLCLSAPAQHIPHGTGGCQHGAGCIYGITTPDENHGAGRGCQRLSGDSHPVPAVQRGLLGSYRESVE